MARNRDINIAINAQDNASRVFKRVQTSISEVSEEARGELVQSFLAAGTVLASLERGADAAADAFLEMREQGVGAGRAIEAAFLAASENIADSLPVIGAVTRALRPVTNEFAEWLTDQILGGQQVTREYTRAERAALELGRANRKAAQEAEKARAAEEKAAQAAAERAEAARKREEEAAQRQERARREAAVRQARARLEAQQLETAQVAGAEQSRFGTGRAASFLAERNRLLRQQRRPTKDPAQIAEETQKILDEQKDEQEETNEILKRIDRSLQQQAANIVNIG